MKALVTGFHMLYRLSPDSKYPWSGENTGPIEIPVLNIPLLDTCMRARPARDASNGALQHSGRGGAAGAHAQAGQRARALGRRGSSARGCAPWSDCVGGSVFLLAEDALLLRGADFGRIFFGTHGYCQTMQKRVA